MSKSHSGALATPVHRGGRGDAVRVVDGSSFGLRGFDRIDVGRELGKLGVREVMESQHVQWTLA